MQHLNEGALTARGARAYGYGACCTHRASQLYSVWRPSCELSGTLCAVLPTAASRGRVRTCCCAHAAAFFRSGACCLALRDPRAHLPRPTRSAMPKTRGAGQRGAGHAAHAGARRRETSGRRFPWRAAHLDMCWTCARAVPREQGHTNYLLVPLQVFSLAQLYSFHHMYASRSFQSSALDQLSWLLPRQMPQRQAHATRTANVEHFVRPVPARLL